MKEFYINYTPAQYINNQEYLMMSNILRDSHEYFEHLNEAVWGLLMETPNELVEISNECAKLCKNRFNEVAIAHTPAKKRLVRIENEKDTL